MCASMPARASASITGPTSTASVAGSPIRLSAIAPLSIAITASAPSSCRQRTRSAEQRWPALSKAEATTSVTTCSASADESTSIAFWPPVSAISGTGRPSPFRRPARLFCSSRATSVEPVNITPCDPRVADQRRADRLAGPGSSCSTARGTPACQRRRTISAAISGVCSAGLASTGLPATSAAAIWPVKIASGKFHGLMQTTGPSGTCVATAKSRRASAA